MPENQEIRDSNFPRDLLRRFMCDGGIGGGIRFPAKPKEEPAENVELSLGLSLNGRFGVEPPRLVANNKLFRASSVANFLSFPTIGDETGPVALTRTCSLPTETEEEWRKRKELQSLRRSEAKRKRVEKLKNVRVVKGKTEEDWGSNKNGIELWGEGLKNSPPVLVPSPAGMLPRPPQFSSQGSGSIGSQGSGGSSGVSDFESQPISGPSKDVTEVKSPDIEHEKPRDEEPPKPSSNPSAGRTTSQLPTINRPDNETLRMMSGDMPCVSTKVEGPNMRKIDGFLYRYRKGEVRIVCVCHGSFLTPAEFVKHAGGGDVDHPLRHIIVNPPSFL